MTEDTVENLRKERDIFEKALRPFVIEGQSILEKSGRAPPVITRLVTKPMGFELIDAADAQGKVSALRQAVVEAATVFFVEATSTAEDAESDDDAVDDGSTEVPQVVTLYRGQADND